MSWLSSFLHPGRQYRAAQDQMQQYYNQAQGAMQPYMRHGEEAYGGLSEAMKNLMDPQALQAQWMEGYETSPQAQFAQQQAQQHGLDAASAMGLMGSQPALQAIQGGTANIGFQDRDNYLNALMDKYKTGIGLGENIYGAGANMASQSAQNAMNMGNIMGGLAGGAAGAGGGMIGQLLGGGLGLGLDYLTGGMGQGGYGRGAWSTSGGR
jgi:hypothetical protein